MAPAAAAAMDEKRQEEKRIKELREFQRGSPANRRCFDCNEMMPQYVCLDFNTFVCTSCSGIHREFAHRVKSLSMSKFTESEVKALKLGGNEAAQKYWRAKHDASFRPHGGTDGERSRNFIRLTYIDRKWVYESPRAESKKDDTRKTASGSSRSKSSFAASADDDFFAPSAKAAAAPTFDAFGDSSAASSASGAGFAQFGDFSAFGNESSTASASAGFADFGKFDSAPKSSSSSSGADGFGDFGDFGGSSGSAKAPTAPVPAAAHSDFGSFKIAPPPGASFSSSSSSSVSAVPAPIVASPAKQVPSDFMAFSPEKVVKDPFGFDDPPATPAVSTPFDAFGAAPASNKSTSSASNVFDAFGGSAPATSASDFGGFGSASFDAFGGASSTAPSAQTSGSFGAFGAPAAAPASPFDAFGASGSAGSGGFGGDFASAAPARSSSGGISSVNAADPFGAFSPRVSGGSNNVAEPAAAAPADPFAAFDGMDSAAPSSGAGGSTTGSFGAGSTPNDIFGSSANQSMAGQGFPGSAATAANDPFAFGGQSSGGGSKSNSFSTPGAVPHQPSGGFAQGYGAGGANPFQQQQQQQQQQFPPQQHLNPMQNGMFMQQQQPGQPHWYGHPQMPQQQHPGQFHMQQQQGQHAGQFHMQHGGQHFPGSGISPATAVQHAKPAAAPEVAAIKDPFAALNIGLGSSNSSSASAASTSRGSSFDQKPGSASNSFSSGLPVGGTTPPFSQSRQGSGSGAGMLGGSGSFPVAAGSAGGSRGNSFSNQSAPSPAFGAPSMANTSPMSSFTYPSTSQPQAPSFPGVSQQPPMAPFSSAQNQSQHDAFADNAFGAFTSAPARTDSLKTTTSAGPANPFDMF